MPKKKTTHEQETLIGIVTPVQWNEYDQVTAVALSATDDEEYRIENGEEFIALLQKVIKASGEVRRDQKTVRTITIKHFSVIENF